MTFPRRLESLTQCVRARTGKRVILDTTHAQLLFEDERHPWRAVPKDGLLAQLAGPAAADDLDRCWWAAELDGTRHDRAVRTWDTPRADCPALAGLAGVHHHLAGQWLEEEHPAEGQAVHRVRLGPAPRPPWMPALPRCRCATMTATHWFSGQEVHRLLTGGWIVSGPPAPRVVIAPSRATPAIAVGEGDPLWAEEFREA